MPESWLLMLFIQVTNFLLSFQVLVWESRGGGLVSFKFYLYLQRAGTLPFEAIECIVAGQNVHKSLL